MKVYETEPQLRSSRLQYIETRWEQLNDLSKDAAERAIKYLTLTNAGGAVAMLSYLGANAEARIFLAPKFALGFFLFGLLFVGILDALIIHHLDRIFKYWRDATQQYVEGKLDWETMAQKDDEVSYTVWPEYVAGYASFVCLIVGTIVGIYGLFHS